MKGVKFIESYPPYQAGDRAGFPDKNADFLVNQNIAEYVKQEKETKDVEKPKVNKMVENAETKSKVYKCKVCDKEFDSPQGLAAHSRVHKKEE